MANKFFEHEIFEINGKDVFMKAKVNSFPIDKVLLSFVKFDVKTKKSLDSVNIYVSLAEMKAFCNDVLNGKLVALCQQEAAKGKAFPDPVWQNMGGVNEENCKIKKLRADGKALSRVVKFFPGKKGFMFQAEQGVGNSNAQGLIVPGYGVKPEQRILVPCSAESLKQFVLMLDAHINSWFTYQFMSGGYNSTYKPKTEETKGD